MAPATVGRDFVDPASHLTRAGVHRRRATVRRDAFGGVLALADSALAS
jgi:hypothetical protein